MSCAIGIDGCKRGWFWFRRDDERCTFGVAATVSEVLDDTPDDACVLVDIPIGLREKGRTERECDLEARRVLKPKRSSSVFPVPCRQVLRAKDYQTALKRNRRILGKGLSRQAWNICGKIREVDELLAASDRARGMMREAHPEVCFAGLAGAPMHYNKKTRDGFMERMTILKLVAPEAEPFVASAWLAHGGYDAERDDIVDAYVLMYCAQRPADLRTLPLQPETDPLGLPMEVVYLQGP